LFLLKATNALGESMNAKIKKIKSQACGSRNRQRFRDAIMFCLGGLDLYPRTASTHPDS
jgi:transposase